MDERRGTKRQSLLWTASRSAFKVAAVPGSEQQHGGAGSAGSGEPRLAVACHCGHTAG